MRLIDADALNGYKFGLISPYAQNLFHKIINEAPTIDYKRLLEQEPCTDAISRQAVLDKEAYTETSDGWTGWTVDVNDIKELPPVKPAEKVGQWIDTDNYYQRWKCSECGCHTRDARPNYCSNCGAKMQEVEE